MKTEEELVHVYSRWDGSQKVDLRWEKLTDELLDRFLKTGDISFALEWLLRQGHEFKPDGPVMQGLNKLIDKLMKLRRDILSASGGAGIADELRKKLDKIVDIEKAAVQDKFQKAQKQFSSSGDPEHRKAMEEMFSKEAFLEGLPKRLRDAMEALKSYRWESEEAARSFAELMDIVRQIQDIMARNWFTGSRPMTLEETIRAVQKLKRISELIEALEQGRLYEVDLDALADLLGDDARRSVEMMMQFMEFLQKEGFIRHDGENWELTTKAVKRIAQKALKDICSSLHKDSFGAHETHRAGLGELLPDQPKPYEFGDPMRVDLKTTFMSAMLRRKSIGTPIKIDPGDFMVSSTEYRSTTATALLLDMSLSMVREGRFAAAKKVAVALDQLIKTRFPRDRYHVIGFATVARELKGTQLVNARGAVGGDIFTNIQDALRLASKLLNRSGVHNKQVIIVTDGQPTAYTAGGELHVEWPVFGTSPNAMRETLKEVKRATGNGVVINTFMLDAAPELMRFVDMMTRINRGRAFYTTPDNLGKYLLVDFVRNRKRTLQ